MPHYSMDRYFRDHTKVDQVRRESIPIKAMSDDQAISEAKMLGPSNRLLWYEVRRVERKGEKVLFSSKEKS